MYDSGVNDGNSQSVFSGKHTPALTRSHSTHNPPRATRRRTFSAQRPLGKSNLSLAYSGYPLEVAVVSPETSNNNSDDAKYSSFKDPEMLLSNTSKSSDSSISTSIRKKKSKPGLKIKLDDLEPRAKKIMSPVSHSGMKTFETTFSSPAIGVGVNNSYMSPGSSRGLGSRQKSSMPRTGYESPNLELEDQRLGRVRNGANDGNGDMNDFYNEDIYLTMHLGTNLDYTQENVTPFMFPPQNDNCDYFGEFNDVSQMAQAPNLEATESQNSTYQGFVNVQDISLLQAKRNYEQSNAQLDYYANRQDDKQKVEAHFTPIPYSGNFTDEKNASEMWSSNQQVANDASLYNVQSQQQYSPSQYDGSQPNMQFTQPGLQVQFANEFSYSYDKSNAPNASQGTAQNGSLDMQEKAPNAPYSNFQGQESQILPRKPNPPNEHIIPTFMHPANGQPSQGLPHQPLKDELVLDPKQGFSKRKLMKGSVCAVCDKFITRDFSRHMRIHDETGRFQCVFPVGYCNHKSRKFNRPYDYKKHLLNMHFMFDDVTAKLAPNLTEKLDVTGKCTACGEEFKASDWLDNHILSSDPTKKCFKLIELEQAQMEYRGYHP